MNMNVGGAVHERLPSLPEGCRLYFGNNHLPSYHGCSGFSTIEEQRARSLCVLHVKTGTDATTYINPGRLGMPLQQHLGYRTPRC